MKKITKNRLIEMSYTEFLSYVYQWNVPPGSFVTLNEWITFAHIDKNSRILEIACTTGFSSREISNITGCKAKGIDICEKSIEIANFNRKKYAPNCDLSYRCEDACQFKSNEKYTHIVLGAALGFFENPDEMIKNLKNLLIDGGMILVSPYYLIDKALPKKLINRTRKVIEINPTNFDYYTAIEPYKNFEIIYENRHDIVPENKKQMEKYCTDTIETACKFNSITDKEIKKYMYDRLYEIKDTCNELHKYFKYSVIVLRYREAIYPNRFVELF